MMKSTRTLCLFLLFLFPPSKADQVLSTTNTDLPMSKDQGGSSAYTVKPFQMTTHNQNPADGIITTGGRCFIDTEMGLIAIGSAGGLIICLLVTTSVLACQICVLQRRVYFTRARHSNTEIMSDTHYWGTDPTEIEGLVGPCDTTVMLEEVRTDCMTQVKMQETMEEVGEGLEKGNAASTDPEEKLFQIQSSTSKDSCLDVSKDLEDMPLVV